MVKGLHSQNRPCLRLAQTQRAHRSIMCDIPRMVPPTSGSLTSRRHRPLLSFLPCRNQFRHCAALPARGGRSDGISKRYAEYRALNFLGRHVMASTPLDGGSFEKASLEKRLPWNIRPHFARLLARMSSVVLSTRAISGCGPNLAGLFSSPLCHFGASCAWERGTARPQGAPSVGNAHCRVAAITAQNLFQSCPSSTLSTSPTPSAPPPILLPRGACNRSLLILIPRYSSL